MFKKNVRQNHRKEPNVAQLDKKGWQTLLIAVLKIAVTCLFALGIPYGIFMYYQHLVDQGHFLPKQMSVHGNIRVDDHAILDASGLLNEDANLFEANIHTMVAGIETIPWIKSASVAIELPDKVDIEVVEYQPLGIVNDGALHIVDETGREIKYWSREDTLSMPIVSLDKPLAERQQAVVQAFKIADIVARLGYTHTIHEVHYDNATGYTLFTDASEIRIGYDRFDERIDQLLTIDQILSDRSIVADYILLDGDSLERAVVKPKPIVHRESASPNPSSDTQNTDSIPSGSIKAALETT